MILCLNKVKQTKFCDSVLNFEIVNTWKKSKKDVTVPSVHTVTKYIKYIKWVYCIKLNTTTIIIIHIYCKNPII